MRVESALAAGIAGVVVASLVVGLAVPGAIAEEEPERGVVRLSDATVGTAEVGADSVTMTVTAFLEHRGGPAENVTVRVRAVGLESGLHEATREAEVGTVDADGEVGVPVNVTVPREGGYRVEVTLLQDGRPRGELRKEVRGVGSLKPPYARSSVGFHRFDRQAGNDTLPAVQYSVASAGDDEVRLAVSAYLTNDGADDTGDLELEFVLRQAESGVVAARERVGVGTVEPGRTATPGTEVAVPDGYNYYIDAILWKDGVIVDSARGAANLDPDRSIRVNRTDEGGGLRVSDFAEAEDRRPPDRPTEAAMATDEAAPGFGAGLAVAALAAAALFARRHL